MIFSLSTNHIISDIRTLHLTEQFWLGTTASGLGSTVYATAKLIYANFFFHSKQISIYFVSLIVSQKQCICSIWGNVPSDRTFYVIKQMADKNNSHCFLPWVFPKFQWHKTEIFWNNFISQSISSLLAYSRLFLTTQIRSWGYVLE